MFMGVEKKDVFLVENYLKIRRRHKVLMFKRDKLRLTFGNAPRLFGTHYFVGFEVYLRMHLLINQCLYHPVKKRTYISSIHLCVLCTKYIDNLSSVLSAVSKS